MKDLHQVKKPISGVIAIFTTGILVGRYLPFTSYFFLIFYASLIVVFGFAVLGYLSSKDKTVAFLLFCGIFLSGLLYLWVCYLPSKDDISKYAFSGESIVITGRIVSSPYLREGKRKRITFIMKPVWVEVQGKEGKERVNGKLWVTSFSPYRYYGYGDIVKVRGKLSIPGNKQGKSRFDWRGYLSYQGIWTQVSTGKIEVVKRNKGSSFLLLAFSTGRWMRNKIKRFLPYPYSSVLKGIMLGDKEDLPSGVLNNFRITGTAHVLVVSGLHIGLLLFIVFFIVRLFGFSQKVALAVALPFVIWYALISGLRPPIVRATLMATIGIICYFLDREVPLVIVLFLAAFFILLINPLSLFTVSFQLSFLATGGIILLLPYFEKKFDFLPEFLKRAFSVSVAAQLSLLPVFAFYFKQFPLIGFVTNIIIIPLITFILALAFFSLALATISLGIAQLIFNTNWLALKLLLFVVNFFSFSWAPRLVFFFSPQVTSPPLWAIFIYYALLFALPSLSLAGRSSYR
ncbi:ComEC family competence protein [Candidatus Aerophobetes bacterium]|nr:ComEC family competence protein [Candidatus Aerophobetes bacterium]